MNVPIALLADYANVSSDGKLNVMGVFDRIWSSSFPAVHLQMQLVLRLSVTAAERGQTKRIEIVLMDADGIVINRLNGEIAIPEDAPLQAAFNQIITIQTQPFPHPGDYRFTILVNGEPKADIPLRLEQIESPSELDA